MRRDEVIGRALARGGVLLGRDPSQDIGDLAELEVARWCRINARLRATGGLVAMANLADAPANAPLGAAYLAATVLSLVPTTKSANYTAAAGDLIRTTATLTVTLPAHSAGQVVAIVNEAGTTTINGTNIVGLGLSSASTFQLGTPGAHAILQDNGTDWSIISGQQDTGWVALALGANIVAGSYAPTARLQGDIVRLRGTVSSNASLGNPVSVATVPSGLRPAAAVGYSTASNQGGTWASVVMTVATSGAITLSNAGLLSGWTVGFDGITYSLN